MQFIKNKESKTKFSPSQCSKLTKYSFKSKLIFPFYSFSLCYTHSSNIRITRKYTFHEKARKSMPRFPQIITHINFLLISKSQLNPFKFIQKCNGVTKNRELKENSSKFAIIGRKREKKLTKERESTLLLIRTESNETSFIVL